MSFPGKRTMCPLQRKLGEPQGANINVQRREKFLASNIIQSPDGLTCTVDWESKRRILKLWMEKIGLR